MQIAHLTDIHIGRIGEYTYGVDSRQTFLRVLEHVRSFDIDFLVITGDLSFRQASPCIYKWIKEQLEQIKIPYYLIPGNHDDAQMLAQIFDLETNQGQLYYEKKISGQSFIFLDTSSYELPQVQMEWLENKDFSDESDVVLFMHHPPLLAGSYYMDTNYHLKNIVMAQKVFQSIDHRFLIFCGHYHTEKSIVHENQNIFLTPSTYLGIDPDAVELKIDERIGWRRIWINESGLQTKVEYLSG